MATLTTPSTLKQTLPSPGNTINNIRDASFSFYLNATDENFVRKLAESSRNFAPNIQDNKEDDDNGEIGVFSADKYFNGVLEVDHSPRIPKFNIPNKPYNEQPKEEVNLLSPQPKLLIQPSSATPSVRSESSWNSQIALLQQNSQRKTTKPNKKTRKGFLAGLGCNCMCSDDVEDEYLGESSFKKGSTFRLSVAENSEKQRKSLDVFGSPLQDKKVRMESKTQYSSASEGSCSSDLFEIESLAGKTTCYAPSEASIEWSVVTASAADFSAMFDYEEIRPPISTNKFVSTKTSISAAVGDTRRRRSSMSLGCNSSKAVRVVDRIANDKAVVEHGSDRVSDSYMAAMRYPGEDKMMDLESDSTPRQRAFTNLTIPRSLPPQPSRLFFIH